MGKGDGGVLIQVRDIGITHMEKLIWVLVIGLLIPFGCEDTDLRRATAAGIDAIRAITLSEQEVAQLAEKAVSRLDQKHRIAPPDSEYAKRLNRLVGAHREKDGRKFEYKVYLSPKVNAFALGDGSIRIYSGLMDMMTDNELRFVIGHEMGHVVKDHIKKKMEWALATSALRKGVASQRNIIGDLARSALGSFINAFLNAQFSQEEEKAADDYGLNFLKRAGYEEKGAIAALEKLATLGNDHSFLSSHPAPGQRAERLRMGLQSPDQMPEKGWLEKAWTFIKAAAAWLIEAVGKLIASFG